MKQQYRKKPVVIEAAQWFKNGDHAEVRPIAPSDDLFFTGMGGATLIDRDKYGVIGTLESPNHLVSPGDWIITGVAGEHYACKPQIFAATYEAAAQPASAPVASIDTPELSKLLHNFLNPQDPKRYTERAALITHIDAWGQQQRAEGMRHALQTIKAGIEPPPARTTSDIAYESLSPERRKKFDADMVLLDQRMQDHRRERERRQNVVPVEVERRVADARGTGVHQDRKPS